MEENPNWYFPNLFIVFVTANPSTNHRHSSGNHRYATNLRNIISMQLPISSYVNCALPFCKTMLSETYLGENCIGVCLCV